MFRKCRAGHKIANGNEIKKSEFTGGQETANFFRKLGFTVEYRKDILVNETKRLNNIETTNIVKTKRKKLNVVTQKNALQKLLQHKFGVIETEKKFNWLKTPSSKNLPDEYHKIVSSLLNYRNQKGFLKSDYQLSCDFVFEKHKLIFEYDENQHFSKARQITLENYHDSIKLNFPKTKYIEHCKKINAKDNSPRDRDERRAFYDTVRDIEIYKHGYTLIRIKHGDCDWESENAIQYLETITNHTHTNQNHLHKIGRIVVKGNPRRETLIKYFEKLISNITSETKFEFLVTHGGFLTFEWLPELTDYIDNDTANKKYLHSFFNAATKEIRDFISKLSKNTQDKLKQTADFITIGIDSKNKKNYQHIELVAVYDIKHSKVIHWTGKFYPTNSQFYDLIRINQLDNHFLKLNNHRILILGCHDLNVFSPRAQATAGGWKKKTIKVFLSLVKKFNPEIIIQHPHTTDTPNIWNLAWRTVEKKFPTVRHFASGIKYYNEDGERQPLIKVLDKTKMGDIIDLQL